MNTYAATIADIRHATERIGSFVHRTPVMTCSTLDERAGRSVFFKCEHLQKTGSFKYRGATNAILKLGAAAKKGVVTHSSGNHGQALALAAKVQAVPAHIVMPSTASAVKKAAVLGYGGMVHESGPSLAEREAKTAEIVAETGGFLIPPFDHPDVIAGQGTACLELLEDVPDLDAVIAPIGGGGLLSGWCITAKGINPAIRVFGAEPSAADAAAKSKAAGMMVRIATPTSIADGLLANHLGQHTWPIIRDNVEQVFTVSEDQIRAAMRLVWERMKQCIEPSAAVGVAVILSDEFRAVANVRKVGVILCGGNVNLDKLYW
ncbi:pyridoxal-phosphate dependent enzyme [Limnoglobus roseus]|uniref:Serine dehydratase n=1 Tax=Limnoglobus roseus TaxID=2598579 RepID=A0A5C1AB50_9BACT|nr:pyridoxal-phosphate dependent enzyme [Limnoglobus roseus]QEL15042.1 serine dehydratase [Limnoglobus roseus]